ncbi:unknown [Akkermansia sp. CAG:344]|nr:unknown [Akkermansia sp. CAG:344]
MKKGFQQFEFFLVIFFQQLVVFQFPQQFLAAPGAGFFQQRSVFQLLLEQFEFIVFFQLVFQQQLFVIKFFELKLIFQQQFKFPFLLVQRAGPGRGTLPL